MPALAESPAVPPERLAHLGSVHDPKQAAQTRAAAARNDYWPSLSAAPIVSCPAASPAGLRSRVRRVRTPRHTRLARVVPMVVERASQSVLADGWDANAETWIEWTGRGLDSYSDHKQVFLPLIPPPGRLTVDVGAGEGRVSRELTALGHRVLAVDYSLTMSRAAASHPEVPVPAVVADARNLPLPNAVADCAVAFMSLHDIDDVEVAIAEIGRILAPGGVLVLAIVHPLNSAGGFDRRNAGKKPSYLIRDSYTQTRHYTQVRTRDGVSMTYHGIHRPLQAYTDALANAGLVIKQLRESATEDPDNKWSRIPLFLHIVAARLP